MRNIVFIILILPCAFAMSQEMPVRDPLTGVIPPAQFILPNNGLPQHIDRFAWNGSVWVDDVRIDKTYDIEGDVVEEVHSYISGEKFRYQYESDLGHDYTYCDKWVDGDWTAYTREIWDFEPFTGITTYYCKEEFRDGVWVKVDEWSLLLELFGTQMQKGTFSGFNQETGQLELKYRYTYSYFNSGLTSSLITEKYQDGAFVNYIKEEYSWLNDYQYDVVYQSNWNNNAWLQYSKFQYDWADELSYIWTLYHRTSPTTEWTPSMRCTHTFDEYRNERRYIYERYLASEWTIMFGTLYNLFYEGLHLVEKIIQEYLGGGMKSGEGEWVNTQREVYSNFYNLGIEDKPQASLSMNCYPVPAGDQLLIEITSINPGSKTLMLTNLTGQPIRAENINTQSSSLTWDISGIPAGIYIVRLYDQSAAVIVRKIIKQ